MSDDFEKKLRELGKERVKYPPPLQTATKAEFVTMARKAKKPPRCSLFLLAFVAMLSSLAGGDLLALCLAIPLALIWMIILLIERMGRGK